MQRLVIFLVMLVPCVALLVGLVWWRIHLPVPQPNPVDTSKLVVADSGLTDAERQDLYHLAEGSEVYPLDWLRVLEDKTTGKPFLDNMERFGFLADEKNPDKLPIGLTADTSRGLEPLGKMVGINCAACHVGEMRYKNTRLRIDGAPNLLNTRAFFASLIESAEATLADPAKLLVFLSRLREQRADPKAAPSRYREAGRAWFEYLAYKASAPIKDVLAPAVKKLVDKEKTMQAFDPAVLFDAKASDFRQKVLEGYESGDVKPLLDKVKASPVLQKLKSDADKEGSLAGWLEDMFIDIRLLRSCADFLRRLGMIGTEDNTDWGPGRVDAFGSARAFLFQDKYAPVNAVSYPHLWGMADFGWYHYDGNTTSVLERNFGQALGVGAVYDRKTFASTLRPMNLHRLESLGYKLKAPKWPEDLFGKIDQERVKRGTELFKKNCAQCHPAAADKTELWALDKIDTDPNRALMFAETLPATAETPFQSMPFPKAIALAMEKIKDKAFEELTPAQRDAFNKDPKAQWRGPKEYAGRPLVAVWATAPYLHNGSVPTLDDLLKPAAVRLPTFHIGHRDYDPSKLGYVPTVKSPIATFDTSKPGNANTGHEYGTTLSPEQRKDLLEYLKAN